MLRNPATTWNTSLESFKDSDSLAKADSILSLIGQQLAEAQLEASRLAEALREFREVAPEAMRALLTYATRADILLADRLHRLDAKARTALSSCEPRNG